MSERTSYVLSLPDSVFEHGMIDYKAIERIRQKQENERRFEKQITENRTRRDYEIEMRQLRKDFE